MYFRKMFRNQNFKKCTYCNDINVNKIPIYNDEHNCIIEYGFKYRGDQKYADVALINKNTDEIIFIFEILTSD